MRLSQIAAVMAVGLVVSLGLASRVVAQPPAGSIAEASDCLSRPSTSSSDPLLEMRQCAFALPESDLELRLSYLERGWQQGDQGPTEGLALAPSPLPGAAPGGANTSGAARLTDPAQLSTSFGLQDERGRLRYRARYYASRRDQMVQDGVGPRADDSGMVGFDYVMGPVRSGVELTRVQRTNAEGGGPQSLTTGKMSMGVQLPRLPLLTLSYANQRQEIHSGASPNEAKRESDAVSGSLWYGRSSWEAYMASTLSSIRDESPTGTDGRVVDHVLGWTFRPTASFSIGPGIEWTRFIRPGGEQTDTHWGFVWAQYAPPDGSFEASLWASYAANRDSQDFQDDRNVELYLRLDRRFRPRIAGRKVDASLGLRMSHYLYDDRLYGSADSAITSALAVFELRH